MLLSTTMSFEIETKIESDYLHLQVMGYYSLAEAIRMFKYSVDTALEHKKSKILIDVKGVEGSISAMERFEMSEFLVGYTKEQNFINIGQIAVIGNEPQIDKDRFGETVAVNRGLNVKAFTNWSDAIKWLAN